MPDSKLKILIVRLSSLGDILLTTPVLRSLKAKFPDAEIDFLVRERYADVIRYNPHLSTVLMYENTTGSQIRKSGYTHILDLQGNLRSKRILSSVTAPVFSFRKYSFRKRLLVGTGINLLKKLPPIPDRYAAAFPLLQKNDGKGLELFTGRELPTKREAKLIALCPGSRHYTKQWPKEYFEELGKMLMEEGYRIILLGGKSDKALCQELSLSIPGAFDGSTNDDLHTLAEQMSMCRAAVCNDSGLMHIAAATGTPLIALFGSTVKDFGFAPYKAESLILENLNVSCRPCSHIGKSHCPKKHFECMRSIKPSEVFQAIISRYA